MSDLSDIVEPKYDYLPALEALERICEAVRDGKLSIFGYVAHHGEGVALPSVRVWLKESE